SGTWSDGLRARRIRALIEGRPTLAPADFAAMQTDDLSLRAVRCLPGLLRALEGGAEPRLRGVAEHLKAWDGRMAPDRVGATLFEVFFANWVRVVVRERLEVELAAFVAGGANGLSAALLTEDAAGWFAPGRREAAIR